MSNMIYGMDHFDYTMLPPYEQHEVAVAHLERLTGLQIEIAAWARETFGPNYGFNDLHKLFDEMEELKRAALVYGAESQAMNDPEPTAVANEAADVMHMLFQLAHNLGFDLLEETRKKFEINKQRTWEPQPDGTYQHVKEATDAS